MSQRPRTESLSESATRAGRLGLPDDVLDAVLAFGDLRSLGAAATNKQLRDSYARSGLALSLVKRRCPLLATVEDDGRSAGELFLSQRRLFPKTTPNPFTPSTALSDYTFSLEIELQERKLPHIPGRRLEVTGKCESLWVGTADPVSEDGNIVFTVPAGIWAKVHNTDETHKEHFRFMASRRMSHGAREYARLGQGGIDDGDMLRDRGEGKWWLYDLGTLNGLGELDLWFDIKATWKSNSLSWLATDTVTEQSVSKMELNFQVYNGNDTYDLSPSDSCLVLERHVEWI